jgi:hypothetical protein
MRQRRGGTVAGPEGPRVQVERAALFEHLPGCGPDSSIVVLAAETSTVDPSGSGAPATCRRCTRRRTGHVTHAGSRVERFLAHDDAFGIVQREAAQLAAHVLPPPRQPKLFGRWRRELAVPCAAVRRSGRSGQACAALSLPRMDLRSRRLPRGRAQSVHYGRCGPHGVRPDRRGVAAMARLHMGLPRRAPGPAQPLSRRWPATSSPAAGESAPGPAPSPAARGSPRRPSTGWTRWSGRRACGTACSAGR